MKKNFRFLAMAVVAMAAAVFTGCSSDDQFLNPDGSAPETRASISGSTVTIDFEDMTTMEDENAMANPTSYGNNYYDEISSTYPLVTNLMDPDFYFMSEANEGVWPNGGSRVHRFMFGGIALSDWAIISNPASNPNPGKPFESDWWMSEYNQMSVYNTARTASGERGGAGANGSNNFGVVYGFDDSYGYTKEASFTLPMGAATLKSLKICNTAYTYGVIQHGNVWVGDDNVTVTAKPLATTNGYLTLIIKCYDGSDNLVKRVETPLADYQNGKNFCVTTWTEIPINASGVEKVQFGFWGSDVVSGGLRTPAYVAIDDIVIEM